MVRVSICIPTYNGEKYIAAALDSAGAQQSDDIEILVSDDGSSDGTRPILERYAAADRRVRLLFSGRNRGLTGNWNHCIGEARGEWIKFLFQDDTLHPGYLARVRPYLEGETPFIINHRDVMIEDGTPPQIVNAFRLHPTIRHLTSREQTLTHEDFSWLLVNFQESNFVGEPSNTMFRRSLVNQIGFFHPGMNQIVDLEFWARIGSNFGAVYIPEALSSFRLHASSATSRNAAVKFFRNHSIDLLIMMHDFCFSPHYRVLREAAAAGSVSLESYFAAYVKRADAEISALEQAAENPALIETEVLRPLGNACLAYPLLWKAVKAGLPRRAEALLTLFPGALA